jgi:hypothetical protein
MHAEHRIFRIVHRDQEPLCQQLFSSELVNNLALKGFIPHSLILDSQFEERLVIEHEYIQGIPACAWSPSMLFVAGQFILDIYQLAHAYGFTLSDAHPWNVVFYKGQPCFLDLGSFVPVGSPDSFFSFQFCESILLPLILWCVGESFWARQLLSDQLQFSTRTSAHSENLFNSLLSQAALADFNKLLPPIAQKHLEELIKGHQLPTKDVIADIFTPLLSKGSPKTESIIPTPHHLQQLEGLHPKTITFYGTQLVTLAEQALDLKLTSRAIILDRDEDELDAAFQLSRANSSQLDFVLCQLQFPPSAILNILHSSAVCKINTLGDLDIESLKTQKEETQVKI